MEKKPSVTLGIGTCGECGGPVTVKTSSKGFAYYICPPPGDGGCKHQAFSRDAKSTQLIAKRITKWTSPDLRAAYLENAAPAPAEKPAPKNPPSSKSSRTPPPKKAPQPTPAPPPKRDELEEWFK